MMATTEEPPAPAPPPVEDDAPATWIRIYPLGWDSRSDPRWPRFLVAVDHGDDGDQIARPGGVVLAIGDEVCHATVQGVAFERDPRDDKLGGVIPCRKRVLALTVPHHIGRGYMVARRTWTEPESARARLAREVLGDAMPPPPTHEQITEYTVTVLWDSRDWAPTPKAHGPRRPAGIRTMVVNGITWTHGADGGPPRDDDDSEPRWWPVGGGACDVFRTACWARRARRVDDDDVPPPSTTEPTTTDAQGFPLGF